MIPDNITKEHIEQAIAYIDENGVPQNRSSSVYLLNHKEKNYPPKYVISIANKFANGEELDAEKFTGGRRTNNFLKQRGFIITAKTEKEELVVQNTSELRANPVIEEQINLTADNLTIMRSRILNLLNQIDPVAHGREGVAARINRLTHSGMIPAEVAPWLRTITEMRNVVDYEGREITETYSSVSLAVWNGIRTWAIENGYNLGSIDGL